MHPFYLFVFKAFGCGLGQLGPNAILQINGVIARCHELGHFPTIDLLFSLYRVKSTGVQFYFDKKKVARNLLKLLPRTLGGIRTGLGMRGASLTVLDRGNLSVLHV